MKTDNKHNKNTAAGKQYALNKLTDEQMEKVTGGSGFDPKSHFENDTDNVVDIYEKLK